MNQGQLTLKSIYLFLPFFDWKLQPTIFYNQCFECQILFQKKLLECNHLPAQLLDEVGSILGDFLRELNHVNASKDDVVGFHRVRARKWRTERYKGTVNNWTTIGRAEGSMLLTCPSAARTSGFPGTSSQLTRHGPCWGWSLEQHTLAFHRMSTSSYRHQSSLQNQSPPEGEGQLVKNEDMVN